MMRLCGIAAAALLCAGATVAGEIQFDTDVIPVLTKAGCNAGACHGAAAGRGEFRLSLYGSRPAHDFQQIARALQGRRISRRDPASSLLLNKATETISHGGGPRLDLDSEGFHILQQWIREGAVREDSPRLQKFVFAADQTVLSAETARTRLTATATFSDGTTRDVIHWTVLSASDDSAVRIQANQATVLRPGRHLLLARFLDRVEPLHLTLPFSASPPSRETAASGKIDQQMNVRLQQLGIEPAETIDDNTFLRRVTLDLTGRLPTLQELDDFEAAAASDPNARVRLIQRLLNSHAYVEYWTFRLARWLRLQDLKRSGATDRLYGWLRQRVAADEPLSDTVRQLLLAEGDIAENPQAVFHNQTDDPRLQAEFITEAFLGVRLKCANCHDHPLDSWTQDDYHGLSAIFATIKRGSTIRFVPTGRVIHPATGEPAVPRLPGGPELALNLDHRHALTRWLTDAENPYFARAIVNRIWQHLLGQGLVNPVDDLRTTNPGTHPELLTELSADFARDFRLKDLLRRICSSDVYRRSVRHHAGPVAARFYACATEQPLPLEVFLDAVTDVTHVPRSADGDQTRAVSRDGLWNLARRFPNLLECESGTSCESTALPASQPSTQLYLLNGALINDRLIDPAGRLMQGLKKADDEALLAEFYRRALSRNPRPAELAFWREELSRNPKDRPAILQDAVWSLLNSREFLNVQ